MTTPISRISGGEDVKLMLAVADGQAATRDDALVALLAKAHAACRMVLGAPALTIKELAARPGMCRSRMAKLVRLSWLAPDLVRTIAAGEHPVRPTPRRLLDAELPACWTAQAAMFGIV